MGGVIGGGSAPGFLINAIKDPDGANLDRIQIVKGWRTRHGELRERVFTVAASNNRAISEDGAVEPLASTVNEDGDGYLNSVGAAQLSAFWRDPDFDPQQLAFYYVRVLEILKPRWTSYDAAAGSRALPPGVTAVVQDRAYSSPVWFQPASYSKVQEAESQPHDR